MNDDKNRWTVERLRELGPHTDVATAASVLDIGRTTAYDLIRRGEFPVTTFRLGTRIRVSVSSLLRLLEIEQ